MLVTTQPLLAACLNCAGPSLIAASQIAASQQVLQLPVRLSDIAARLLAYHNVERATAGVPPLLWDADLEAAATLYASSMAATARFNHSTKASRPDQSENLWWGLKGAFFPEQMVRSWTAGRAYFQPGAFPFVSRTGNWMHVSHYTQVIWRTTTKVGCAIRSNARIDYLVCRYSPKGNRDGQRVP